MADLIPPLVVGVQLDASQLNAGVNAAKGGLNGLGTSAVAQQGPLGSLTKTLGALGIAFGAYQIFQFGKGLLDAAEAETVSNARLENITKSMGLFGSETSAVNTRLEDLAQATALNTGVDEDSIKATQAKLMTFKELGKTADEAGGAFDRATQAAIDMASAGFGEAETNAVQLGKALNDPVKGITALGRAGITFTDQEKEQIKTMVEQNNMLGAQQMVLGAIETQVGGTAEATATGTGKMGAAFEHLQETLGLALMPAVEAMAEGFAVAFGWIADNLPVIGTFVGVLGGLTIAFNALAIANAIENSQLFIMAAALLANPITWIVLGIAALAAGIVWLATKTTFFQDAWKVMTKFVGDAWNATVKFFVDGFTAIGKWFTDLPGNIAKALGNAFLWLYDTGKNMIQGLLNGAGSLLINIGKFFLDMIPDWIVAPFKAALGIHSPSTVFHGFGQNIVQGLIDGVGSMDGALTSTMGGLADTASGAFSASVGNVSSAMGGAGVPSGLATGAGSVGVGSTANVNGSGSVNINAPVSVHTNANAQDISGAIVNAIKFNLPYVTTGVLA